MSIIIQNRREGRREREERKEGRKKEGCPSGSLLLRNCKEGDYSMF